MCQGECEKVSERLSFFCHSSGHCVFVLPIFYLSHNMSFFSVTHVVFSWSVQQTAKGKVVTCASNNLSFLQAGTWSWHRKTEQAAFHRFEPRRVSKPAFLSLFPQIGWYSFFFNSWFFFNFNYYILMHFLCSNLKRKATFVFSQSMCFS